MRMVKSPMVQGLVAGTRKAGTTWLYENFRKDPSLLVSEKVKESGFFAGAGPDTAAGYEALFESGSEGLPVEVDTSICYASDPCARILKYNSEMRVALVFREPAEYLASRHRHSQRKGELVETDPVAALANNAWLRDELDYAAIVERFAPLGERNQLTIFDYADLKRDPFGFYRAVKASLGGREEGAYQPFSEAVNVGRTSKAPIVSKLLSDGAKAARKLGAHRLVNSLKGLGLHSKLEENVEDSAKKPEGDLAEAIEAYCPGTSEFYNSLGSTSNRPT